MSVNQCCTGDGTSVMASLDDKNRLKSSTSTSSESCLRCMSSRSNRLSTSSLFSAANNHSL